MSKGHLFRAVLLIFLILAGVALLYLAWFTYAMRNFGFEGPPRVQQIALADLNGNGRLDAYLAIAPDGEPYIHADYLLWNEGNGRFVDSQHDFGEWPTFSVATADINHDSHQDIILSQSGWVGLFVNDGRGAFRKPPSPPTPGDQHAIARLNVALADLNGDGSLDIFGAACCGGAIVSPDFAPLYSPDQVWLNVGNGRFQHNQQLAQTGSNAVALGDLNGDGTVDAFVAAGPSTMSNGNNIPNTPNTVWLNDGQGRFDDSGQRLGNAESTAVALGDLNGNGFLDAVVGQRGADEIWFNDGQGQYRPSGQQLGNDLTRTLFLADLDGDGDLDLLLGGETGAQVWLNDGQGQFHLGQTGIGYGRYEAIALGDVTGDGLVDIFVAGVESYEVWHGARNGRFTASPRITYRSE